ncbi:adenylate/guanylate cyclase domain-containing protein [Rhodoferax sp. OV413]|uniref:adenylate/guanylate cyclase domain-containing protein n=1 Tax=Rhodoferax sp. OV413 TaxID=1855285 RepID=UPI0025D90BE1|nr:adenylate/guanylate cyclase domain-containing protein [Rhodoferax sp. OV413]
MGVQSTVVFTDLHGSTAAYGAMGNAAAAEAITRVTSWIGGLSAAFGGRLVKKLGDGVMVVFADGARAVDYVMDVQRRHAVAMQRDPWELRLPIRVGVASGEVEVREGDCYGDAVNVASRLCDLCGPGQIWITSAVIDMLPETLRRGSRALGPIFIRGRGEPCDVFQLEWSEEEPSEFLTMQAPSGVNPAALRDALGKEVVLQWQESVRCFQSYDLPAHVGRIKTSDFVVADPRVSRTHAQLEWRNGAVVLVDLSSYGTWVRFSDGGDGDVLLRREECLLHGAGLLALGAPLTDPSAPRVEFEVR